MEGEKKNIILISNGSGAMLDSLFSTDKYNVKLYVMPYKKDIEKLKSKYGDKIEAYYTYIKDTNNEFQSDLKCDYDLTYDEIEKYRTAQLKCYRYNSRFMNDDNTNNSIYYTALKFFLNYFNENKVDCVISYILEHGSTSDSLIFDIAKLNGIPVYIFSQNSGFGSINLLSLLYYNEREFIDISKINKNRVDINLLIDALYKNYSANKIVNLPFSKSITKFKNKKNKTFIECIKWFYNYKIKFYIKNFKHSRIDDLYKICEDTSFLQMIKGHFYFRKIKKFYKRHSFNKIEGQNYIFYPLHLEPEAAIMARLTLNCQLFIIEQISQMLPVGWYLYVKEHPDQFNGVQFDKYMHKSVFNFRNIDFYKRITKLKNVKLIKLNNSSSQLIDDAKATLSISGSALIEAVAKKKPVIILGNDCTFIEKLRDTFSIRSLSDISNAIDSIKNDITPQYDDLQDITNQFAFSFDMKNLYSINDELVSIFGLIYNMLKNN